MPPLCPRYARGNSRLLASRSSKTTGRLSMVSAASSLARPSITRAALTRRRLLAVAAAVALAASAVAAAPLTARLAGGGAVARASSGCDLHSAGDQIQHVIY